MTEHSSLPWMISSNISLDGKFIIHQSSAGTTIKTIAVVSELTDARLIIAAVNAFAKLPDLVERSAREAIKQPLASLDKFEGHYSRLRESHADLLAAAKEQLAICESWGIQELPDSAGARLRAAIAKAEQA